MQNNNKSKYIVVGLIGFVLLIYTASYFYTKDNNMRLLSSPRIVMLLGDENTLNDQFESLNVENRRILVREMYIEGQIFSLSQNDYNAGITDIADHYKNKIAGQNFIIADCMAYGDRLKKTMQRVAKNKMKAGWIFSACGVI